MPRVGSDSAFDAAPVAGGDRGFRSEYRLRKTDEYSSVFAFRRALRSAHFQLSYRPNEAGSARLGTVVGKKQARNSVRRNLVKRLAREAFRLRREKLPAYDLVLRLTRSIADAGRGELRAEIDGLMDGLQR